MVDKKHMGLMQGTKEYSPVFMKQIRLVEAIYKKLV